MHRWVLALPLWGSQPLGSQRAPWCHCGCKAPTTASQFCMLLTHPPPPVPLPLQSADGSKTVLVEWGREGDEFDLQKQVRQGTGALLLLLRAPARRCAARAA